MRKVLIIKLSVTSEDIQIISGVNKHTFCRQVFKDYNILIVVSLHILDVICYIKKYKDSLEQNVHIHNYNTQRKLDLQVQFCSIVLFRKSAVCVEIRLCSKVPDRIKKWKTSNLLKREINPLCYIMLYLQWMIFHHFERIWIVNVSEFYHW
jgi:hypothetical protein